MSSSKLYELGLSFSPRIGNLKTLISYCGSAQEAFNTPRGKLEKIPGIGRLTSHGITNNTKALKKAEAIIKYSVKNDVKLLFYTIKEYPSYLKQLSDAPAIIYLKGNSFPQTSRHISMVGARSASSEGKENVRTLIGQLSSYNPIIVSGLAYGIDIEAHKAALENNLITYGVLATGIEKVYPSIHTKIVDKMLFDGGLLTEYPPNIKMDPSYFSARNRIIAGLSGAKLVVEAGEKGGALITAYLARDYDREVFAIPGNLNNELSVGCNNIIKNNVAPLVSSAKDIAFHLGWKSDIELPTTQPIAIKKEDVSEEEWIILQLLNKNELHIDELSWKSQVQVSKLATILLILKFRNIVVSLAGKKYKAKNG